MRKKFGLILSLCFCLIGFGADPAKGQDEPKPFENGFFEIGYKTVEEAVKECEELFDEDIVLPYKIPPVQFTHYFGRCNKDIGSNNDFEIEFIHEDMPENHYHLTLRPRKHAIAFKPRHIEKSITLDKSKAFLIKNRFANELVFARGNWSIF